MRNKILIIEDDKALALTLKDFLEENAMQVWHASSGEEGLSLYHKEKPDLIVLDVMLPQKSGFDVIAEIRDKDFSLPIIMMTGSEFDVNSQTKGFHFDVKHYLKKPVVPQVLLAQIQSILFIPDDLVHYKIAGMAVHLHVQYIKFDGTPHQLREKDFEVLTLLFQHQNHVVPRSVILKQIWKDDCARNNGSLDASMSRIRRIVKEYPSIRIKTIYATGYMLTDKITP